MENVAETIVETEPVMTAAGSCGICTHPSRADEKFCSNCGFPIHGTDDERSDFDLQYRTMRAEYESGLIEANKGTKALYWLAGLIFLGDMVLYAVSTDKPVAYLVAGIGLPAIFVALAQWSKKKPFEALASALIVYVTVIAADAIAEPTTLAKGIIIKIIIIGALIRGVKASNEARTIWRKLQERHWDQPIVE